MAAMGQNSSADAQRLADLQNARAAQDALIVIPLPHDP